MSAGVVSLPLTALAASITVTASGTTYTFSNGTTANSSNLVSTVNGLLTSGNELTVDRNTALALSNQNLSLGAGSSVNILNGSGTNILSITGGSTTSSVYLTGTTSGATVSGSDVSLGAVTYSGTKPIVADISGTNTITDVTASSGTVSVAGAGTTTVSTLNIENNSSLKVDEGSVVKVATLNYDSTGTVANAGTLSADTVTIDASKVSVNDVSNLSLSSVGTVAVTNVASGSESAYQAAVQDALPAGTTVAVAVNGTSTTVTGTGTNADSSAATVYDASKTDPFNNKAPSLALVNKYGSGSKVMATAQAAGKVAALPSLGGQRALGIVNNIAIDNVTTRLSDLRSGVVSGGGMGPSDYQASMASNNIWASIKYGNTEVKGDYFDKSKVKVTTYQVGYDKKLNANTTLGLYLGTLSGHVEFGDDSNQTDIDSAFNFGIYASQKLNQGQYLDYIARFGTLKNKLDTSKWTSKDLGLTLEYGKKIETRPDFFLTPYIQFNYDHYTVDDVTFTSGNTVKADNSNNLDVKLGLNLEKYLNKGDSVYGGVAYSRGLSGKYQSYLNDVTLPSADNKANIVYLDAGYKHYMTSSSYFNINVRKTLCDYNGWTVEGRLNFMF